MPVGGGGGEEVNKIKSKRMSVGENTGRKTIPVRLPPLCPYTTRPGDTLVLDPG